MLKIKLNFSWLQSFNRCENWDRSSEFHVTWLVTCLTYSWDFTCLIFPTVTCDLLETCTCVTYLHLWCLVYLWDYGSLSLERWHGMCKQLGMYNWLYRGQQMVIWTLMAVMTSNPLGEMRNQRLIQEKVIPLAYVDVKFGSKRSRNSNFISAYFHWHNTFRPHLQSQTKLRNVQSCCQDILWVWLWSNAVDVLLTVPFWLIA